MTRRSRARKQTETAAAVSELRECAFETLKASDVPDDELEFFEAMTLSEFADVCFLSTALRAVDGDTNSLKCIRSMLKRDPIMREVSFNDDKLLLALKSLIADYKLDDQMSSKGAL